MTVDHSYEESTMTDVSKEVLLELDNKKEELEEVRGELKKTERDLSELRIENTDQARNIKGLSTQLEEVQKSLSRIKEKNKNNELKVLIKYINNNKDKFKNVILPVQACRRNDSGVQYRSMEGERIIVSGVDKL